MPASSSVTVTIVLLRLVFPFNLTNVFSCHCKATSECQQEEPRLRVMSDCVVASATCPSRPPGPFSRDSTAQAGDDFPILWLLKLLPRQHRLQRVAAGDDSYTSFQANVKCRRVPEVLGSSSVFLLGRFWVDSCWANPRHTAYLSSRLLNACRNLQPLQHTYAQHMFSS